MKLWIPLTFGAFFAVSHPSGAMAKLNVTGIASLEKCFANARVEAAVEKCAAPVLESVRAEIEESGEYEYLNLDDHCEIALPSFVDVVGCLAHCAEYSCHNDTEDLLFANPELFGIIGCPNPLQDCVVAFNSAPATKAWTFLELLAAVSAMALKLK